jgi:hypothetical protein
MELYVSLIVIQPIVRLVTTLLELIHFMKSIVFAATILSIISLNWSVFTSENGGFSIMTPASLDLKVQTIPTQVGEIQLHTYSHNVQDSTAQVFQYSVTYYEYPEILIPADSTEMVNQFFTETLDAIAERIDGHIVYSEPVPFRGYPAMLTRISYKEDKFALKNKMVLANNRFYLIEVFSTSDKVIDEDINKFIDSFKLLQ